MARDPNSPFDLERIRRGIERRSVALESPKNDAAESAQSPVDALPWVAGSRRIVGGLQRGAQYLQDNGGVGEVIDSAVNRYTAPAVSKVRSMFADEPAPAAPRTAAAPVEYGRRTGLTRVIQTTDANGNAVFSDAPGAVPEGGVARVYNDMGERVDSSFRGAAALLQSRGEALTPASIAAAMDEVATPGLVTNESGLEGRERLQRLNTEGLRRQQQAELAAMSPEQRQQMFENQLAQRRVAAEETRAGGTAASGEARRTQAEAALQQRQRERFDALADDPAAQQQFLASSAQRLAAMDPQERIRYLSEDPDGQMVASIALSGLRRASEANDLFDPFFTDNDTNAFNFGNLRFDRDGENLEIARGIGDVDIGLGDLAEYGLNDPDLLEALTQLGANRTNR